MAFEFLHWRPKFKTYERGVKRGDILFERPRPRFNVKSKGDWGRFFLYLISGYIVGFFIGAIVGFIVYAETGSSIFGIGVWALAFGGGWILFMLMHLVHSIRFYKRAKLTDVEFVPLDKAKGLGKRLLTMPEDLTEADYDILFSRYVWADVERQPYRDVTDWVETIETARSQRPQLRGATGISEAIGEGIALKYLESRVEEIVEMGGGVPSPREIVKILQTELVPKYREELGEELMSLYFVFLGTQPPTLPFTKTTSRSEMREVATASDTVEVLEYLRGFTQST